MKTYNNFLETPFSEDKKWIQKATKNMRKDKPCTGEKFGSETCPPGSKRYNLAKTFKKMAKEAFTPPEDEKSGQDKSLDSKQKQAKRLKQRVLLQKLRAVRQGEGTDIMASHTPEGEMVEATDKAFEYVKKQIAAKYGKSGYVSKDNPRKPQTDADKAKARAHQAKVDKENAAERAKDPSQGRYPKG